MNLTPAFIRKVIYLAAMVPPLLAIVTLGMPAVGGREGASSGQKGYLAQLREENNLSPANLGDIDPASETMRLSTLGLRGVAVSELWRKANDYKRTKDFDNLKVSVDQIVMLQPNFISVWEFQAHNLSYNVSVEFDDYRDRYSWVTKGIAFLMSGTRHNRHEPRLHANCGWFISQKIGRADEFRQFRRLFRVDNEFHQVINGYVNVDDAKSRADFYPDNWLVGRLWYLQAEEIVETRNARTKESPWLFFSHAPRCLISYAIGLDRDGELPPDEISQQAWRDAEKQWDAYGARELFTGDSVVQLASLPAKRARRSELSLEVDALASGMSDADVERLLAELRPELREQHDLEAIRSRLAKSSAEFGRAREKIRGEKTLKLDEKERALLAIPLDQLKSDERAQAAAARFEIEPTMDELVAAAPAERRSLVERKIVDFREADDEFQVVDQLDAHSKFHYWKVRCQVEATREARDAKSLLFQARRMAAQARLQLERTDSGDTVLGAKELFEQAWDKWALVFERNPEMYENVEESQMLLFDLIEYDRVLQKLDLPPLPHDFKLKQLLEYDTGLWTGRPLQPPPENIGPENSGPENSGTENSGTENDPTPPMPSTAPAPESSDAKPPEPAPPATNSPEANQETSDKKPNETEPDVP